MLIYFNRLRIKYAGCVRFVCFSAAAYAVLNFAPAPQSHGKPPESYPHFEPLDVIPGVRQDAPAPQYVAPRATDYDHILRRETYPHCSRSVRAIDVLPANSPRRAHDGNLSQLHAYLSCVWWADGPDVGSEVLNDFFPYYNSKCADAYQCVAIAEVEALPAPYFTTHSYSDLLSGGFDNQDIPRISNNEEECGLDIMDVIIRRRELGMTDICSAKIKNPIEILCAGYKNGRQRKAKQRRQTYTPAPNPCLPASERYYRNISGGRLNAR